MALAHFLVLRLAAARIHVGKERAGLALVVLGEEGMSHGCLDANAAGWLQLHHLSEQVDRLRAFAETTAQFDQILVSVDTPLRESHFHLR